MALSKRKFSVVKRKNTKYRSGINVIDSAINVFPYVRFFPWQPWSLCCLSPNWTHVADRTDIASSDRKNRTVQPIRRLQKSISARVLVPVRWQIKTKNICEFEYANLMLTKSAKVIECRIVNWRTFGRAKSRSPSPSLSLSCVCSASVCECEWDGQTICR